MLMRCMSERMEERLQGNSDGSKNAKWTKWVEKKQNQGPSGEVKKWRVRGPDSRRFEVEGCFRSARWMRQVD